MSGESAHLLLHLRKSRAKARAAAIAEALNLLRDLGAEVAAGGAMAESGGVIWIDLPPDVLEEAQARLPRLGYTVAVDLLVPPRSGSRARPPIRWRRRYFSLERLYEEPADLARASAPDRRSFMLETHGGVVREVRGYRGNGEPMGRRALAVCDARLLVNLVRTTLPDPVLLDPFAGAGGIVREGVAGGFQVLSSDCDPALRYGLKKFARWHCVADARRLPLASGCIAAIATEPPFDKQAEELLTGSLDEMHRVLMGRGKLALLCAAWQSALLRQRAAALSLAPVLDCPLDRKGLGCHVLAWEKP